MNNWHQSIMATVGVLPALLCRSFSPAAWANDWQQVNPLEPRRTFSQPQQDSTIESFNTCQQVAAKGSGLYVREEPTVYSKTLAILPDGQNVAVANGGTEYWVPTAPLSGYLFRGFFPLVSRLLTITD